MLQREIAGRNRAEQALGHANELLAGIIESSPELIAAVNTEYEYITFNEAYRNECREIFGVEFRVGASLLELLAGSPEDQKSALGLFGRALKGETVSVTEAFGRPEQSRRWYELRFSPIRDSGGRVTGAAQIGRNITERKRSEQALSGSEALNRTVVENTSAIILRIDARGQITFANKRALDFFGYSERELLGKAAAGTIIPARESTGRDLRRMIPEITASPDRFRSNTNENIRKNGERVWVEWTNSGIYEADGRLKEFLAVGIDITERKRAEEALQEGEARFRAVLENMSEGVMLFDRQQNLFYQNQASLRIHGFGKDEEGLIQRDALPATWKAWDVSGRPVPFEQWPVSRVFRGERFQDQVLRVLRVETGQEFYGSYNGSPDLDSKGKLSLGFITIRDITEHKQAEEALRTHRELLETVVKYLPMQVCLIDHDLRLQLVNPAYQALAPGKQMVGRTLNEIWPEAGQDFEGLCRRVLETGEAYHRQDELNTIRRQPDGEVEERYFTWSLHRVQLPGDEGWGILNTCWETTERKRAQEALRQSEERFRVAQELSPDGFSIFHPVRDEKGRVVDFTWVYENATIARLNGTDPKAVLGKRLLDFFPGHRHSPFLKAYREVAETGRPQVLEAPYHGDSIVTLTWFRVAVVPMETDIAVLAQDITERKRFQGELERLVTERTARLQELVADLEHFSYTITHDMRAPLRAMMGFAELLNELNAEKRDAQEKEFLNRIVSSARRMDLLITDALNFSRVVRQEMPLEPVDLGALLRGMVDTYPELQPSRAQIRLEDPLPVVLGNEAGLTQCFSNLLGNAVKFVQPGRTPEVRVWGETFADGHPGAAPRRARIWVEDKGIGISPQMLPRVFQMFTRASVNYEGTGIGLALVRKVVERMGGKVGVESEEGNGSRFWLELRAVEP